MKILNIITGNIYSGVKMAGEGAQTDSNKLDQAKLDSVEWGDFYAKITEMTGIPSSKLQLDKKIERRLGATSVKIQSKNLIEYSGLFKGVFSAVEIDDFGSKFFDDEDMLTISVHISWKHISGGSNGAALFTSWYDFKKKEWEFRDNS